MIYVYAKTTEEAKHYADLNDYSLAKTSDAVSDDTRYRRGDVVYVLDSASPDLRDEISRANAYGKATIVSVEGHTLQGGGGGASSFVDFTAQGGGGATGGTVFSASEYNTIYEHEAVTEGEDRSDSTSAASTSVTNPNAYQSMEPVEDGPEPANTVNDYDGDESD